MKRYVLFVLVAFDQLVCALLGGWPDETLSSYAWRMEQQAKPWGRLWRPAIDWLALNLFRNRDHCRNAWESTRTRAYMPLESR